MHIYKPNPVPASSDSSRSELELLVNQPSPQEMPPCPGCQNHTPANCSSKCPQAPQSLSSEPENFPIEQKVVPIVYGLSATRLLQPCWSCEGHINDLNKLYSIPRISFYALSPLYPKMLLQHINTLKTKRKLAYDWQIILSDYAQTTSLTYTLQPDLNLISEPHLGRLQHDLIVIAEDLPEQLKQQARDTILKL